MLGIIVGTHGHLSEQLVESCKMICGTTNQLKTVTLVPGEGIDSVGKKYQQVLEELDTADGVIFLNDLFGGSPYNAACRIAVNEPKYGIVAGVNLPMLIEMVSLQMSEEKLPIQEVMEKAVSAGTMGVQGFHQSQMQEVENEL
ncbi:MAG: system, mannose/fructose/sorbose family, subunit [Firmicutes bacterium]|nr:system, mannose/fructose/sorbose family, subunit [Bacillota bacterium]